MIHIQRTKSGKFCVYNVASNGLLLKASEPLSSKAKCWQNIKAEMKDCYYPCDAIVQDDTTLKVWIVPCKGTKYISGIKPKPIYQPGRNKYKK